MMNDSEFRQLVETSWRRPLREDEQARLEAWLAVHPEERAEWEADSLLNQGLQRLPDAPMSSNFTSLVLQSVAPERRSASRTGSWVGRLLASLPRPVLRLGWSLLALALLWAGYSHHESVVRKDLTKGLTVLASIEGSDAAILEDFDVIRTLGQVPPNDDDALFTVLSQ